MVDDEDLKLPEKDENDDGSNAFYVGEKRELSQEKKKFLKKQKKFEYDRVQMKGHFEKEEKKEALKTIVIRWTIIGLTLLYIVLLYFWLL